MDPSHKRVPVKCQRLIQLQHVFVERMINMGRATRWDEHETHNNIFTPSQHLHDILGRQHAHFVAKFSLHIFERKIFNELWNPENWLCLGNGDYLVAGAYLKMISYLNLITHNLSYQFLVFSSITNMYRVASKPILNIRDSFGPIKGG